MKLGGFVTQALATGLAKYPEEGLTCMSALE